MKFLDPPHLTFISFLKTRFIEFVVKDSVAIHKTHYFHSN